MKYCWTTINVSDMEKSLNFYREILGLPVKRQLEPAKDMKIAFLGKGETQLELMWNRNNGDISFSKDISIGFEVDSIADMTEYLTEKGIKLQGGPYQPNPFIRFIYILDPDGLKIQLVENIKIS